VPNFQRARATCPVCAGNPLALRQAPYTYLLGLYLGDGCLAAHPRDVYRLRISCASAYPELIRRCEQAITEVLPVKVNRVRRQGCFEVYSFSKHWPCLFPQHGPGRKHERKIELTEWQQALVDLDPRPLLRGLLHSDGCRVLNWVNGTPYPWVNGTPYPRYHFSNVSKEIDLWASINGMIQRLAHHSGVPVLQAVLRSSYDHRTTDATAALPQSLTCEGVKSVPWDSCLPTQMPAGNGYARTPQLPAGPSPIRRSGQQCVRCWLAVRRLTANGGSSRSSVTWGR